MRCGRGTLAGQLTLIAGVLAVGALRPRLLDVPRHAWGPGLGRFDKMGVLTCSWYAFVEHVRGNFLGVVKNPIALV